MATYAYKVKGRKVELLEKTFSNEWVTPITDQTASLKFEYTERAKFLDAEGGSEMATPDESSWVDLPQLLSNALVNYVKGRLAEDAGEIQMKEYFDHQFQKVIDTHEESKTHGLSQTVVGGWGIKSR